METPIKMDDLGVPPVPETPICVYVNIHIYTFIDHKTWILMYICILHTHTPFVHGILKTTSTSNTYHLIPNSNIYTKTIWGGYGGCVLNEIFSICCINKYIHT